MRARALPLVLLLLPSCKEAATPKPPAPSEPLPTYHRVGAIPTVETLGAGELHYQVEHAVSCTFSTNDQHLAIGTDAGCPGVVRLSTDAVRPTLSILRVELRNSSGQIAYATDSIQVVYPPAPSVSFTRGMAVRLNGVVHLPVQISNADSCWSKVARYTGDFDSLTVWPRILPAAKVPSEIVFHEGSTLNRDGGHAIISLVCVGRLPLRDTTKAADTVTQVVPLVGQLTYHTATPVTSDWGGNVFILVDDSSFTSPNGGRADTTAFHGTFVHDTMVGLAGSPTRPAFFMSPDSVGYSLSLHNWPSQVPWCESYGNSPTGPWQWICIPILPNPTSARAPDAGPPLLTIQRVDRSAPPRRYTVLNKRVVPLVDPQGRY